MGFIHLVPVDIANRIALQVFKFFCLILASSCSSNSNTFYEFRFRLQIRNYHHFFHMCFCRCLINNNYYSFIYHCNSLNSLIYTMEPQHFSDHFFSPVNIDYYNYFCSTHLANSNRHSSILFVCNCWIYFAYCNIGPHQW